MAGARTGRTCGPCSLCCTVLRVDALRKLGGTTCRHVVADGGGCGIHPERPSICRAYRCLWLQGGLEDDDRPDRLGAVLDLVTAGADTRLEIHEGRPGVFDASPRLRAIAGRHRAAMTVRVHGVGDPWDPDRPYRVLHPDGTEQHVAGERIATLRDGRVLHERRLPWLERGVRRLAVAWRRWRLRRFAPAAAPPERAPAPDGSRALATDHSSAPQPDPPAAPAPDGSRALATDHSSAPEPDPSRGAKR